MSPADRQHLTRRDALRLLGGSLLLFGQKSPSQRDADVLTGRLQEFVSSGSIAGVVALVSRSNRLVYLEAVGSQDHETGTRMKRDTIFDIWSITKVVTAMAVMCLAEDRKLRLDEPVSMFLPEFADIKVVTSGSLRAPSRPMTLLDLLTHTSGMSVDRPAQIENITRVLDRPLFDVRAWAPKPALGSLV